jgi:hypothetical protein
MKAKIRMHKYSASSLLIEIRAQKISSNPSKIWDLREGGSKNAECML